MHSTKSRNEELRDRLKASLPELLDVQQRINIEESFYRFYDGSQKTYNAQFMTTCIVDVLQRIMPERQLSDAFMKVVNEGTGKQFSLDVNSRWDEEARPIINALLHAKQFLDLAVKYAQTDPGHEITIGTRTSIAVDPGYAALRQLYRIY